MSTLKQFDIIQIIDTKNVHYLSGPPGSAASPHGNWSIVGFVGGEILAAKDETVIRIPASDVRLVGLYNKEHFYKQLQKAGKERNDFNVIEYVSENMKLDYDEAKRILLSYNLPITSNTERGCQKILEKIRKLYGQED